MAVDVLTEITINRTIDRVFEFASEPDNVPAWYENIRSVEWRTERPLQVGSKLAFIARFLGRELAYTYEVVELSAPLRMVMRTSDGPFPMETTYEFSAEDDSSTRMTLRNRGNPTGFSALAAPFMGLMIRRANRKDLALLKRVLETSA